MTAHGEHEHHEHENEAFPRHTTVDAVAAELAQRTRRELAQRVLVAVGLALVALALPTSKLIGQCVALVDATASGAWVGAHLLPCAIASALAEFGGMEPERAWFFLAACAFAAASIPLTSIARSRGWEPGPALLATLLALSAPVALVAATSSDASAFRLLGASILVAAFARPDTGPMQRASAWFLATSLHAANAWAWPALIVADLRRTSATPLRGRFLAAVGALGGYTALFLALHGERELALHSAANALLAGGSGGLFEGLAWWVWWLPALGAAGVGVAAWLVSVFRARGRREPEFAVLALVPWITLSLTGSIEWELPWLDLVPFGLLGLLALAQRAGERAHTPRLVVAAVALALWGLVGAAWTRGNDLHAEWTARARWVLEPGDVVFSASAEHRHLLRHRFRVETIDLRTTAGQPVSEREAYWAEQRATVERLMSGGRRFVFDADAFWAADALAWPDTTELQRLVRSARPVALEEVSRGSPFDVATDPPR